MSTSAIIMMIITLAIVWGGLIISLVHHTKHPDEHID
ncbi:methionine/alanine import family NSS transporter small subunit [Hoyosella sp. YIM 151337]|nr:methionine/alanine import family NSS transporter small subunit [Hoyosella sp. YIM 151337]MCW4355083.1 methionine/alanine import family NSS transporter small subunit [Hoyosella sp. YIM 151337]